MIASLPQTVKLIKKNNRSYKSRIRLEFVNFNQDNSLALRADYGRKGTFLEHLVQPDLEYYPNRMHIGMPLGQGKGLWPAPMPGVVQSDGYSGRTWAVHHLCGYVGLRQGDVMQKKEYVYVRMAPRKFKKLDVLFAPQRTPSKYMLQILDKNEKVIWQQTYHNSEEQLSLDFDFDRLAHKIVLCILKPPASGLRTNLLQLNPSYTIF